MPWVKTTAQNIKNFKMASRVAGIKCNEISTRSKSSIRPSFFSRSEFLLFSIAVSFSTVRSDYRVQWVQKEFMLITHSVSVKTVAQQVVQVNKLFQLLTILVIYWFASQPALISKQVPVWLCGACEEQQASVNMTSAQCWPSLRRRGFPAAPARPKHSSNINLAYIDLDVYISSNWKMNPLMIKHDRPFKGCKTGLISHRKSTLQLSN